jgi:hypothetical protein
MVTKTIEEIEVMREQITTGKIPHNAIELYLKEEERQVFGVDVKHDKRGRPIEQGIGSAAQPSRNSIEAYKTFQLTRRGGPEARITKISWPPWRHRLQLMSSNKKRPRRGCDAAVPRGPGIGARHWQHGRWNSRCRKRNGRSKAQAIASPVDDATALGR